MTTSLAAPLRDTWDAHLNAAWANGLPLVNGPITDSNPFNGSPYVTSLSGFLTRMEALPGRSFLRQPLTRLLHTLAAAGYAVDFFLAGGSFLDMDNTAPKDFDALCMYRVRPDEQGHPGALVNARKSCLDERLDLRFVAIDGEPLLYLKTLSYFSILYAQQKPTASKPHRPGVVLIDAREALLAAKEPADVAP